MSDTKTKAKAKKDTSAARYPLIAFRLSNEMKKQIMSIAKADGVSNSSVIKDAITAYINKRK